MNKSRVDFNFIDRDDNDPVGYKTIICHLIFDAKMNITRKARYVAGGHLTDPPLYMTYAIMISRDSVLLDFLITVLNDIGILVGKIQNAYLNAPTKEKVFFYGGDEWKSDQVKVFVVVLRFLYGLKYCALAYRNYLSEVLGNSIMLQWSLYDTKIWFKAATDESGNKYYTYILFYVDDFIIVYKDPRKYMAMLESE